jgi:hypothetical protein
MRSLGKGTLVLLAVLVAAGGAWAQMRGGSHAPQIPGMFKPVVGSGAEYRVTTQKQEPMEWAYAIVGKENVNGDEGYWLEERMLSGQGQGMVMKQLMVPHQGQPEIKRMIMQMPGRPPMEMPMGMMGMMQHKAPPKTSDQGLGEKVGTETVTVPAGTFVCDHYRTTREKTTTDAWVSTQVHPYGLVKMASQDMNMVLVKTLANQTSLIKGEPQKFEMPHF